jgi:predicted RNase H-like HicB family nuclease
MLDDLRNHAAAREGRQTMKLTAVFEPVPGGFVAFVEEWCATTAQGATIEEARENLRDAFDLTINANRLMSQWRVKGKNVFREPF